MPVVRSIVRNASKDDYRFSAIILGIVRTDAFQMDMVPADKSRPANQKVADVR